MKRQIILALAVTVLTASAYTILPNSSEEPNLTASDKISNGDVLKAPAEEKSVFITFNKEETGKAGLWTKADAHTYFDDFTAKPLK